MADKITDMNAYKQSAAYQSLGIDKLQEQLAGYQTDDAALRQQAEAEYKPTYDANLEALKQQTAQQIQGYQGQLAGLGTAYDKQREKTNESYNQSILSASNALTRRGLGRSSLVATQGAYLEKQRNEALADINADQTAAANAINEKIALLTDQAAQSEKTMAGSYASQIEARMNELKQKNQSAATSLQLQISALQQQGYQAYQEQLLKQQQIEREQANLDREYKTQQEQWQKEFDAQQAIQELNRLTAERNWELAQREQQLAEDQFAWEKEQYAKKSSGGGSSGSSYGGSTNPAPTPAPETTPDSDNWIDKLLGNTPPETPENLVGGALAPLLNKTATVNKTSDEQKALLKTNAAKMQTGKQSIASSKFASLLKK